MTYPVVYTSEPKKPSGGPRKGTKALHGFILSKFDVTNLGIYNPRDVCGNVWPKWKCKGSQHARGAAGDAGVPVERPEGHPEGHQLAEWLVDHHEALGVQEVIYAGKRWTNQTLTWRKYDGRRSDHFDHVHYAQNDPGADGLTLEQILAVWNNNPPPIEPPVQSQEDDMKIIHVTDGPDSGPTGAGQTFLVGEHRIRLLDSVPLIRELERTYGPASSQNGVVWAVIKGQNVIEKP